MTVYIVFYTDYITPRDDCYTESCPSVDSVWINEEAAQERAKHLGGYVCDYPVRNNNDLFI